PQTHYFQEVDMGQVRVNVAEKCLAIPQWFFFTKKIPVNAIHKELKINSANGKHTYTLMLTGNFGEEVVTFNDYEGYANFVYSFEKALMAS
ncbi:MAG: hypothetical protein WCR47_06545, partial [Desulfoplanes sp.]